MVREKNLVESDETEIEDEAATDTAVPPIVYNITSYGADYDVRGIVDRINKSDILIPPFQRAYVWKQTDASSFIESLLLGLPVPGIFLATEKESNKLIVIDGQQRLRSLQFFYNGFFDPNPSEEKKKIFKLVDVQPQFEGKTYEALTDKDKRRLDNAIIHATIVKQEEPRDGDTSIYHIFYRLNAGGMILKPQEIRRAAFHGPLLDKITELNKYGAWRDIFGKVNKRLKDEELILRFLALYFNADHYAKPMEEFLNDFTSINIKPSEEFLKEIEKVFKETIDIADRALGSKAFRVIRAINAAVFDSIMVGISRRLKQGQISDFDAIRKSYEELKQNSNYLKATSKGTSDEAAVALRLNLATKAFSEIK
jgi:uncharacterized protein with ParB-like and HNH nuclease domain